MKRTLCLVLSSVLFAGALCEPGTAAQRSRFRSRSGLRNNSSVKAAFKDATTKAVQSTVRVFVDGKAVSLGCVVSADGEILTKGSLVGEGDIKVRLSDGTTVSAAKQGTDANYDLVLLKAESGSFTPVEFTTATPDVGRFVATPSESGSVVGVGIVTIEVGRARLRKLGNRPEPPGAYLGINLEAVASGGVRVTQTVPRDAPAYRSGLRKDDVIISFDGFKIKQVSDILRLLRKHKPGERVKFKVKRDGEQKESDVRLGVRPGIDKWGGGPFSERRYNFPRVITHDANIKPEECGGPLVTSSGEVIGLNIARALRVATYAVPAEVIEKLLPKLRPVASETSTEKSKVAALDVPPPNANKAGAIPAPTLSMPAIPQPGATGNEAANNKDNDTAPDGDSTPVVRTTPLVAAGIKGSLLVYNGKVGEQAMSRFIDLAKRARAKIVVIDNDGEERANVVALKAAWTEVEGETFHRISVKQEADANDDGMLKILDEATAVWICEGLPASALTATKLAEKLDSLAENEVPVAAPASLAATTLVTDSVATGVGMLPDSLVSVADSNEKSVQEALRKNPLLVNYQLGDGAVLLVRKRYIFAADGSVTARFAPSKAWPEKTVEIRGRQLADLTALRRFAARRTGPLFPPKEPEVPNVDNGTLMIVGGGGMPRGLSDRFLKAAGGENAVIVVIPISMPASQLPERDRMAAYLKSLGAKEVHVLKQRTPEESDKPEVLDILRRATGVWFGGGRQWRFIDAYENTEAAKLMHDVLKRGGVIAGSSAGASIQGDYMARGNPLGPRDIMADGYETGLRFLKGVAIDQHFTQRNRLPDMTSLMDRYPQLLGIGLDETTAIVVKKNIAEVVGKNRVCFYDRRQPVPAEGPDFVAVEAGGKYDLVARKVIDEK